jgi:succinoglycan biosynthesis protein ExoA
MRICLIMPIYNESANLPDVLASLDRQTIDHGRLFLIAVDGESTDGSADIVRAWLSRSDIDGIVLENPRRAIPTSLNLGIEQTREDDFIVRLDAHTTYGASYIEDLMRAFEVAPADVVCIGGPQRPGKQTGFDREVVAALLTNPMGLGGADFRTSRAPRYCLSPYLGAWRPGTFRVIGGYDESSLGDEDTELAARLLSHGMRSWCIPLESEYRVTKGLLATARQWGRYGFWKARTLRRHPRILRPRHLAPPLAIFACLGLLASPARWLLLPLYGAYCTLIW